MVCFHKTLVRPAPACDGRGHLCTGHSEWDERNEEEQEGQLLLTTQPWIVLKRLTGFHLFYLFLLKLRHVLDISPAQNIKYNEINQMCPGVSEGMYTFLFFFY